MRILRFQSISFILLLLHGFQPAFSAILTDGPIAGGVNYRSAKIFVRTDLPATVKIEYSTAADLSGSLFSDSFDTLYSSDLTKIIILDNLQVSQQYYYRVLVDGQPQQAQPYPFFKTFPLPGSNAVFNFALIADVGNFNKNSAPVYATISQGRPDFLLQIGDWDHRDPDTLSKMRKMHREVRGRGSDAGVDFNRYLAGTTALFHVWDDHDYGMNDGDYTFPGKSDAIRAYLEYYPTADQLPNPDAGIWQKLTYAQAEIYMLDVRSNRDPNSTPDDASKSMLNGEGIRNDQKSWLLNSLLRSTATWKFITSGVPFNPTSKPSDGWGAFTTEWDEIVSFVEQNQITGVIMLSGDLHSGGAFDDGTNSGLIEMSVPHTNMNMRADHPTGVTTLTPGEWSEGLLSGVDSAGYGLVRVLTNPDRVILEVRGEFGDVRKSFEVLP